MYCNVPRICPWSVSALVASSSLGANLLHRPEIEQLDPVLGKQYVGRLQVPMNDSFLVRRIESIESFSDVFDGFSSAGGPLSGVPSTNSFTR